MGETEEARQYAAQIKGGFDIVILLCQDPSEENREALMRDLRISELLALQTANLETGCAIVVPRNGDPFDNQFLSDEVAAELIRSRQAQQTMVEERVFVPNIPRVAAGIAAAKTKEGAR